MKRILLAIVIVSFSPFWGLESPRVQGKSQLGEDILAISVDAKRVKSSQTDMSDFALALSSLQENNRVHLRAGRYLVDNPVYLSKRGTVIIGSGSSQTIFHPKNAGEPLFVVQADEIVIKKVGMNALTVSDNGRATFAVYLTPGITNFGLADSRIAHTGASSILGHSIKNSFIHNNQIVDAGDDGIQLSGTGLTVTSNIIVGVYDEPIDVTGGAHIFIKGNFVTLGRIGITVGNSRYFLVYHNAVADQSKEGMIIQSDKMGIVIGNIIEGTPKTSFVLNSPVVVSGNIAERSQASGFLFRDIHGGIIKNNVVKNAESGFEFVRVKDSYLSTNVFCNSNILAMKKDENGIEDENPRILGHDADYGKPYFATKEINEAPCPIDELGHQSRKKRIKALKLKQLNSRKLNRLLETYTKKRLVHIDSKVKGLSDEDRQTGMQVKEFINRHNPGFVSISVNGATMRCEINNDLYATTKGAGRLGIGLFRVPYMILREMSGTPAALTYLTNNGKEVAVLIGGLDLSDIKLFLYNDENSLGLVDYIEVMIYKTVNQLKSLYWTLHRTMSA